MFFQTLLCWMAIVGKTLMATLSCSVASCVTDCFYKDFNFFYSVLESHILSRI